MESVNPILKKILIAALAIFVLGTSALLSQLCYKVGQIEHILDHVTGAH